MTSTAPSRYVPATGISLATGLSSLRPAMVRSSAIDARPQEKLAGGDRRRWGRRGNGNERSGRSISRVILSAHGKRMFTSSSEAVRRGRWRCRRFVCREIAGRSFRAMGQRSTRRFASVQSARFPSHVRSGHGLVGPTVSQRSALSTTSCCSVPPALADEGTLAITLLGRRPSWLPPWALHVHAGLACRPRSLFDTSLICPVSSFAPMLFVQACTTR
jgi:hypothetical protein